MININSKEYKEYKKHLINKGYNFINNEIVQLGNIIFKIYSEMSKDVLTKKEYESYFLKIYKPYITE